MNSNLLNKKAANKYEYKKFPFLAYWHFYFNKSGGNSYNWEKNFGFIQDNCSPRPTVRPISLVERDAISVIGVRYFLHILAKIWGIILGGPTHATAVSKFADPDVVCAARDVENFQWLVADDSYVIAMTGDHSALWRNNRPTAECYNTQNNTDKQTALNATYKVQPTRNLSGDEIPQRDVALFCYPSCI